MKIPKEYKVDFHNTKNLLGKKKATQFLKYNQRLDSMPQELKPNVENRNINGEEVRVDIDLPFAHDKETRP